MFKTLFLISLMILPFSHVLGKVTVKWMSVASFVIDDGETKIMLDPMFTRAGMKHWLNLSKFKSDEELVKKVLNDSDLMKVNALFASHSHFDHVVDAPMVAKLTGGTFYTDESSEIIAKAYKDQAIKTQLIQNKMPIQIGKFKVTPVKRGHNSIALQLDFLPGQVPADFDFGFYDYHVGDTWFYLIEHPEGVILIDQGGNSYLEEAMALTTKADVLIQGVANRVSDEEYLAGYFNHFRPKVFIPSHFDNFLFSFNPRQESLLPFTNIERLFQKMTLNNTAIKAVMPKYNEEIVILE